MSRPIAGVAAALLLAGCGGSLPGLGTPFAIDPGRLALLEGDTVELEVTGARDGDVDWSVEYTSVVRLVEPGLIAAVGVGRTRIRVEHGELSALAYVYVDRAVLVGAGDIAVCGYEADEATAELLDDISGLIWTAGDNAYPSGTSSNYRDCYDPTWGRHKARTRPTPGNHEYRTEDAAGYFDYFGDAAGEEGKGWYAYRYGGWLVLALNSNLSELGEDRAEEQLEWLEDVLAEEQTLCTVAYFHHPFASSGSHGNNDDADDDEDVASIWATLYRAGADVVLAGHDHHYERFVPLNDRGEPDAVRGIRSFVVGTGGASLRGHGREIHRHSAYFDDGAHGVLELVLHEGRYDWQFVSVSGRPVDNGSGRCH